MSIIDKLVTDRTQADVNRVKQLNNKLWVDMTEDEKGEWFNGTETEIVYTTDSQQLTFTDGVAYVRLGVVKGAYNYTDLNRVGQALEYLADRLTSIGYPIAVDVKTDWVVSDYIYKPDISDYLEQVETIRGVLALPSGTPQTPAEVLTFSQANDIEKMLVEIEELINKIIVAFSYRYLGTMYCGELI